MSRKVTIGTESFGTLLRRHRGRRGLTQEELAERSGLHAQGISQLERGVIRSPRSRTVEFLADALKLDACEREAFAAAARGEPASSAHRPVEESELARQSRSLTDAESCLASMPMNTLPPRAPLPAGSRMPLAPNPLFVGRGDELLRVAQALMDGDTTVAVGQVVASTGLGGLGKTQLAVELVHRYGRYFAGGVYWLSFASADEIPLQVAGCAGPEFDSLPLEQRVQRVRDAWQSAVPRLLIFDNCEEETLLEAWRPTSGGSRVLATSRRSHWSPTLGVTCLPVDLLPRGESIELLRRYRPDLAPHDPCLHAIAAEVGDLPLALHLAGCYLRAYRVEVSLVGYLAELRQSDVVRHASLLGAGLDDSPSPTRHAQSVAATFALCLARLDRRHEVDRVAIALLARLACMTPGEPVPRDLLARTLEDVDARLRVDGLRRLDAVGLVEENDGRLKLHRLLAHFVRQEGLDPDAQPAVVQALISCGDDAEREHLTGSALDAVIPHLVDVAGDAVNGSGDGRTAAKLCTAAGWVLRSAGDLRAARPWYERALAIQELVHGHNDPNTAVGLTNLGVLLRNQGERAAARPLLERALAIREQALGPGHPDTAWSLSNLGVLFDGLGDQAATRSLFERALAIRERALGPEHPDTARALDNLGIARWNQGELAAARQLMERALVIRERVLGPEHPQTAASLYNLGGVLKAQGDLVAARPRLERALAIWERALGPEHLHTAFSLEGIGDLLSAQGERDIARPFFERALTIRERVLGPEHSLTARTLNNLAYLLLEQGELEAARPLFERTLAVRERTLGPDHPETAWSLAGLGQLLQAQGELVTARPLMERVLAIRERSLGPDHPQTAAGIHELALLFRDQGDPAAACPLFERALAIRDRVLGSDHPDAVATRRALAELVLESGAPAAGSLRA